MKCAELHRQLGAHISMVRSISMDSWNSQQLQFLEMGGNKKFISFIETYDLNKEINSQETKFIEKYKTKAAEYYRQKLNAIVENKKFDLLPPSKEEGQQILYVINEIKFDPIKKSDTQKQMDPPIQNSESKIEEQKKGASYYFSVGVSFIKDKANKASEKIKESGIGDKIKNAGNIVADKAKSAGNYVYDKAKSAKETIISKGKSITVFLENHLF